MSLCIQNMQGRRRAGRQAVGVGWGPLGWEALGAALGDAGPVKKFPPITSWQSSRGGSWSLGQRARGRCKQPVCQHRGCWACKQSRRSIGIRTALERVRANGWRPERRWGSGQRSLVGSWVRGALQVLPRHRCTLALASASLPGRCPIAAARPRATYRKLPVGLFAVGSFSRLQGLQTAGIAQEAIDAHSWERCR